MRSIAHLSSSSLAGSTFHCSSLIFLSATSPHPFRLVVKFINIDNFFLILVVAL